MSKWSTLRPPALSEVVNVFAQEHVDCTGVKVHDVCVLPKQLGERVATFTFLSSLRCSPFLHSNMQILLLTRLKALSSSFGHKELEVRTHLLLPVLDAASGKVPS